MENGIGLWQAIRQMRELSGKKETFSLVFMSYNKSQQSSQGVVRINKAKLRASTPVEHNKNADYMLNFLDVEKNLPRQLYQICLMEFNGKRIILT